ncbi:MAG TPA: STAS domain-containing protein [Pseudonocardiaceae bacterium]|nr:STAS domain-containing protein [Pseudonocardiaceae bacterium]
MTNTANPSDRQTNLSATASSTYPLGPAAATDHTPLGSVALPAPTRLLGLSVQHYPLVGITVMVVDGELDLLTVPVVEQYLRDQLVAQPAHLILDLESVRFLGASGLSCLLGARELVGARGSQLHLAGLITSAVQRAVKATGLLGLFSTYPTLLHAVIDLLTDPTSPPPTTGYRHRS